MRQQNKQNTKKNYNQINNFLNRNNPEYKQKQQKQQKYNNNNRNRNNRNYQRQYNLNSQWKLYVHNLEEKDWSLESYKEIYTFKTIEDCWVFFNNYKNFRKFNFYIMRDNIKPVYEDPQNKNGYSYSYIIPGRKVTETFTDITVKMFSEMLLEDSLEVCGLSLTPKQNSIGILKIWLRNKDKVYKLDTFNDNLINGRFQVHRFY